MSSRCCCMKIPQIATCFRVFVPSSGRTSGPCVETSCASEAKRLKVLASASWPSVSSSAIPLSVESNGSVPGWPPRERQDWRQGSRPAIADVSPRCSHLWFSVIANVSSGNSRSPDRTNNGAESRCCWPCGTDVGTMLERFHPCPTIAELSLQVWWNIIVPPSEQAAQEIWKISPWCYGKISKLLLSPAEWLHRLSGSIPKGRGVYAAAVSTEEVMAPLSFRLQVECHQDKSVLRPRPRLQGINVCSNLIQMNLPENWMEKNSNWINFRDAQRKSKR